MDQASRLRQHDNVQQQISAFEKLLQHAINRFSTEKLYVKLRTLTRVVGRLPVYAARSTVSLPDTGRLSSVRQLRDILDGADATTFSELGREEERQLLTYFQRFYGDIDYLRRLKKQFDYKIYRCLYEYYYDPGQELTEGDSGSEEPNDDSPSQDFGVIDVAFDERSDKEKLAYAVRELYNLNAKWDALLREEPLHMDCFDQDSYHEIVQFSQSSAFEPLLRLVPDIFVRAYKSVELAKIWWTAANKVYDFLPREHVHVSEYDSIVEQLRSDVEQMEEEVRTQEALLASLEHDLRMLKTRENRCNVLGGEYDSVEARMKRASEQYGELMERRRRVLERLKLLDRGTSTYRSAQVDVRKLNGQLDLARQQHEQLSFKFDIIKQDFTLELELRPEFIRYVADVKEKMSEAKEAVAEVKQRKRTSEKRLALFRTNRERMRQIMTKHLRSASAGGAQDGDVRHEAASERQTSPTGAPTDESDGSDNQHTPLNQWSLDTSARNGFGECTPPISRGSVGTDSSEDVTSRSLPKTVAVSSQLPRQPLHASDQRAVHVKQYSSTSTPGVVRRKRGKRTLQTKHRSTADIN